MCKEHDIRGYPTITAFRGLGWLESSTCISEDSQKLYKSYTRMDYHGVLQVRGILGRGAVVMVIRGYIKVIQEWITMEYYR